MFDNLAFCRKKYFSSTAISYFVKKEKKYQKFQYNFQPHKLKNKRKIKHLQLKQQLKSKTDKFKLKSLTTLDSPCKYQALEYELSEL